MPLDAPVFMPATRFVSPEISAQVFSTKETSIADLRTHPQVWAIVLQQIPNLEARISNEMLKPHLGNFSLRTLVTFGIVKSEELDLIDVKLRALGEVK